MARECEVRYNDFSKFPPTVKTAKVQLDYMSPFGAVAAQIRWKLSIPIAPQDILEITDLQNNRTVYLKQD